MATIGKSFFRLKRASKAFRSRLTVPGEDSDMIKLPKSEVRRRIFNLKQMEKNEELYKYVGHLYDPRELAIRTLKGLPLTDILDD